MRITENGRTLEVPIPGNISELVYGLWRMPLGERDRRVFEEGARAAIRAGQGFSNAIRENELLNTPPEVEL